VEGAHGSTSLSRGLDVWRVTKEGTHSNTTRERQFDAIAKSTLLSSLCDDVFNRVFASPNTHELWKQIIENHEGSSDVASQKYHILADELTSFKQLATESAHDMFSRLNTLVNEINALGLKQLTDGEVNHKIIRCLRKPDYDIIKTILLKEDLDNKTPNQVINTIMAHEYSMGIIKHESTSTSSQKSLAVKHTQPRRQEQSSSEEEEEDESGDEASSSSSSSSEDKATSRAIRFYHTKMAKYVRKLYMLGYETRIREDAGVFKMAGKKKSKQRRHQACPAIIKEKKGGKGSSSDESSKPFTTRSSHICLMTKGNSDVSDDSFSDDEPNEICEMMSLIKEQQDYMLKQKEEIKALKANEELHVTFVSRYENLINKFNLLDKEHGELKKQFEDLELKCESLTISLDASISCAIPCAIPIVEVDASTSCDLTPCNENVVVETCDDLIARENEELKQEVEKLTMDLRWLKGKEAQDQVRPPQDNPSKGMKKLEKGETVTCFKCHKEGHKSYQCKQEMAQQKRNNKGKSKNKSKGKKKAMENKNSPKLKASLLYTKPTYKAKLKRTHYILEKKKNGKVVAHTMGWRNQGWNWPIWVPKDLIQTMEGSQKVWVPKT